MSDVIVEFKRKVRATRYAASVDEISAGIDRIKVHVENNQVMLLAAVSSGKGGG